MTDIQELQAIGRGYGLGIFTPTQQIKKTKAPDPKISIFKASDQGLQQKQQDLSKLELVGTKIKKHQNDNFTDSHKIDVEKQLKKEDSEIEEEFQQQKQERQKEFSQIFSSNVKSNIKPAGGFQVNLLSQIQINQTQIEEKKQKNKKKQKNQYNQQSLTKKDKEETTKREIMEKIGIQNDDMDEYFDILNDRVFDKKQPDNINNLLQEKVQMKLENVQKKQDIIYNNKIQLEAQRDKLIQEKQEIQSRLYGLGRQSQELISPPSQQQFGYNQIDDDELFLMQNYIQPSNNLSPTSHQKISLDQLIQKGCLEYDDLQQIKQQNSEKLKESELIYYKNLREKEKQLKESKLMKEKIDQGIMRQPLSQEDIERIEFEENYQAYKQQDNDLKESMKISNSIQKKEFERFQCTSPNPKRIEQQTNYKIRENISPITQRQKLQQDDHFISNKQSVSPTEQHIDFGQKSITESKLMISTKREHLQTQSPGPKTNEIQMIKQIFSKLDKNKMNTILKIDLIEYLNDKQDLLNMYTLNTKNLNHEVNKFTTQVQSKMTIQEFTLFLKQPRKVKEIKKDQNFFAEEIRISQRFDKQQQEKITLGNCLLSMEQVQVLKSIFDEVDKNNDYVAKRSDLVQALRNDVRIMKILHLPAVFLSSINKSLTVDRVIYRVEKEQLIGSEAEKIAKEFMTWNQFFEYFSDSQNSNQGQDGKDQFNQFKICSQLINSYDDQNEIDLDDEMKQLLKNQFDRMELKQNLYVNAVDFVDQVRSQEDFYALDKCLARRKADLFDLQHETLGEVLDRLILEADEFIEWDEIMEFFTRRGRPKYHSKTEALIPQLKENEDKFMKKVKQEKNNVKFQFDQDQEIKGYDSDPEINTYSRVYFTEKNNENSNRAKSLKNLQRDLTASKVCKDLMDKSINYNQQGPKYKQTKSQTPIHSLMDLNYDKDPKQKQIQPQSSLKTIRSQTPNQFDRYSGQDIQHDKIQSQSVEKENLKTRTIPKPFNFDARDKQRKSSKSIRQRRLEEDQSQREAQEQNLIHYKFKPKHIPESVLQRDLFKQKMQEQEERRKQIKENSIAITLSKQMPFSFYDRDNKKKSKKKDSEDRKDFIFKANKVPWFCKIPLLEKINNEEKAKRQERIAEESKRLMEMARLPKRMEQWAEEQKAIQQESFQPDQGQDLKKTESFSQEKFKASTIPDFKNLHKQFQNQIENAKKNKKNTVVHEFNFQQTTKLAKQDFMDQDNMMMKSTKEKPLIDKVEQARKWKTHKPQYTPVSTKKFEESLKKTKQMRDEKQQREMEQIEEDEKRLQKREEIKKMLVKTGALKQDKIARDKENEEKRKELKKSLNETTKQTNKMIQGLKNKAKQQPFLVERPPYKEKQLAKYKALNKMLVVLEKNKIADRDKQNMFTQQELIMLEDLENLRKLYPKYFQILDEEQKK